MLILAARVTDVKGKDGQFHLTTQKHTQTQFCDLSCHQLTSLLGVPSVGGGGHLLHIAPADISTSSTKACIYLGSVQWLCVCLHVWQMRGSVRGTRQDKEDEEVEEVTESVSDSPAAGLYILYFYSMLPALLTDALMKDKTELNGKHKQTHIHTRLTEWEKDLVAQKRSLYSM